MIALAIVIAPAIAITLYSAKAQLPPERQFVGFVHVDQPVYSASAREIFENGNGIAYASPYSNLPDSPRVYSHFGFLLIGYTWKVTGLSLPAVDYVLRAIAGAIALVLLVGLFRAALPGARFGVCAAVAVIACGGWAWLVAAMQWVQNIAFGTFRDAPYEITWADRARDYLSLFSQAEGGYGEWHLNAARSLVFTPEAIYHALFFGCALAIVKRRFGLAAVLLFLAWWSHPFTGTLLGLIVGTHYLIEAARSSSREAWVRFGVVTFINGVFLAYNLIFLPRFEEHRSIQEQMRGFGNPMLASMLLPAYGAFIFLPVFYLASKHFRRHWRLREPTRFMTVWLVCAPALIFHDRWLFFVDPIQPMHFTRGYFFIPLVYFSFCALRQALAPLARRRPAAAAWLVAAIIVAQLPDNILHLAQLRAELASGRSPYAVSIGTERMINRLNEIDETLTIHAIDAGDEIEAFIPVLTHHRALLAHRFNTPGQAEKAAGASELRLDPTFERAAALGLTALIVGEGALDRVRLGLAQGSYEVLFVEEGRSLVRLRD